MTLPPQCFRGVAPGVERRAGNKEFWPLDVFEI
jgi:hypothetical protein